MTRPPASAGGKCSAVGIDKNTRWGRFRADDSESRRVFYKEDGLKLSASCDAGTMKVYASTSKPDSLLHVSSIGDGTPIQTTYSDFSKTEASPEFILNFGNLSRNGQIGYVRPDGKTVFLNYVGSNSGNICEFGVVSAKGKAPSPNR